MMAKPLVLLVSLGVCVSCGSSPAPTAPTTPTPTPSATSVTLTVNAPAVGSTVQATATATLSNGTTVPITSGFGGDASGVATVSGSGAITGVASGPVTVWADYQGVRGSKLLHVLPNYAGTFSGSYSVDGCQSNGDFSSFGFCGIFTTGQVLVIGIVN
jgi:hypothetical protein